MSTQVTTLSPRDQAIADYQQGGGLDDCPSHYDGAQRQAYEWYMHRLQVGELNRMREAM